MAFTLKASSLASRLLKNANSTSAPQRLPVAVRNLPGRRLAARPQQIRAMASDAPTDVTLDKSTPDSVWKTVLDAQEVRRMGRSRLHAVKGHCSATCTLHCGQAMPCRRVGRGFGRRDGACVMA